MATVLIVDDNEMLRTYAARNLESDIPGIRVVTAGTCAEARQRVSAEPIQVLVLDQRLEDGLGTDLLRDLSSRFPGLRVIMATGEAGPAFRRRALGTGAVETLVKPYDLELLVGAVQRALTAIGCPSRTREEAGSTTRRGAPATAAAATGKLRHRTLNRLSALLAGLRVCEAELLDGAANEAEVRRAVERYFPRFLDAVGEASCLVQQMEGERDDTA